MPPSKSYIYVVTEVTGSVPNVVNAKGKVFKDVKFPEHHTRHLEIRIDGEMHVVGSFTTRRLGEYSEETFKALTERNEQKEGGE